MEASWLVFGLLTALSVVIGRLRGWDDKADAMTSYIEAVCVFPDDKSFMRRLAYVEGAQSANVTDEQNSKTSHDGGIWKVTIHSIRKMSATAGIVFSMCVCLSVCQQTKKWFRRHLTGWTTT